MNLLKQKIENLLLFLDPLLGLANCHMVDYFISNSFNLIPKSIQNEVVKTSYQETINLILNNNYTDFPELKEFVENCNNFSLNNFDVCLTKDEFFRKINCDPIDRFKLEIFMTSKKSHEVEILSALAASVANFSNVSHLVDIGDGKGYLSSFLALHHKIPVLGIDSSKINTNGANKRAAKLSKVWKGIPRTPKKSFPAKTDNFGSRNVNLYKQITQFVSEDTDLAKIVSEIFLEKHSNLGIIGLHTCGNLAANSLKIFLKNDSVKFICNVGCCYHLLDASAFPLSKFLSKKNLEIPTNSRMIANQSVDRILNAKQLPKKSIYYRALFQVLLKKHCEKLPEKHVGKFRKSCENFVEYSREALKRIGVNIEVSDEELEELDSVFGERLHELNLFYLLRCRLSPVIESLILLDRLLFLRENGIENSFLVQLFDPVISPRCYGVVAIKEVL